MINAMEKMTLASKAWKWPPYSPSFQAGRQAYYDWAAQYDPERLLWVPGKKLISIPNRQTFEAYWSFRIEPGTVGAAIGSDGKPWGMNLEVVAHADLLLCQEFLMKPTTKTPTMELHMLDSLADFYKESRKRALEAIEK